MAPPRSSRLLRKHQRKKRERYTWMRYIILSIAASLCFFLGATLTEENDFHYDVARESDSFSRCEESCNDILKAHKKILAGTANDSLALSAVDALFSYRGIDIEEDQSPRAKQRKVKEDSNHSYQSKSSRSNDSPYKNLGSRPAKLHPLIQALVGTVDELESDYASESSILVKTGDRSNQNDAVQNIDIKNGELPSRDMGDIENDDSVAMVAAAAAAALWSESETKRGGLRMKTFDEDWEESLRWIASWGHHQEKSTKAMHSKSDNTIQSRGYRKQHKNQGNSRGERFNEHQKDLYSESLALCIRQCLDGEGGEPFNRQNMENSQTLQKKQKNSSFHQIKQMLIAVKSLLSRILTIYHILLPSEATLHLLKRILGMVISSAAILGTRNLREWWRHKTSLQLLLAEEPNLSHLNGHHQMKNKQKTSGKKPTPKKGRRRKRCSRPTRDTQVVKCNTKDHHIYGSDDASVSSDSSTESIRFIAGKDRQINNFFDYNSDQVSKDNTSSTCSHITEDTETDCQTISMPTDAGAHYSHDSVNSFIQPKSRVKTPQRSPHKALSMHEPPISSPIRQKNQMKSRHDKSPPSSTFSTPKLQRETHNTRRHGSTLVPTEAQREQASRQLREFQLAQIQKYIKAKEVQTSKRTVTNKLKGVTLKSPNKADPSEAPQDNMKHTNSILQEAKSSNQSISHPDNTELNIDVSNFVGSSILNMLDESDELNGKNEVGKIGETIQGENGHIISPSQKEGQLRSIALGDLLAGNFLTPKQSISNSVQKNPWSGEMMNNTSNDNSLIGSPSRVENSVQESADCTDANICLQVSAREFSPSWDGEKKPVLSDSKAIW